MELERARQRTGAPMGAEELELDELIRQHPRTPETDAYKFGFERLAERLARRLGACPLYTAYNEFCAPSIPEAVGRAIQRGAISVTLVSAMMTPGGSHAEKEIPEIARELQLAPPTVKIRYAWPFELEAVAALLEAQVARFAADGSEKAAGPTRGYGRPQPSRRSGAVRRRPRWRTSLTSPRRAMATPTTRIPSTILACRSSSIAR